MVRTIREVLDLAVGENLGVHRTYRIWKAMKSRCYYEKHEAADRYKGVVVCDRWLYSFLEFLKDMGHPPSETHSLDRKNTYGDYEPNNCRWATKQEQSDNKRNVVLHDFCGERLTVKAIAMKTGTNYHTLRWRMQNKGMSLQEALNKESYLES